MIINTEISLGDIIAFCSLLGSISMFILTKIKQKETKDYAKNANAYNESAKKYYDLMAEQIKTVKKEEKALCDANIVHNGKSDWVLKIFNKGKANATNISFKFLIDDAPDIMSMDSFPIRLLEPQKNVDFHLGIYLSLATYSWDYEITWINTDGTIDRKIGILTLPLT